MNSRKANKGLVTGLVISFILVIIHILIEVINYGSTKADFFLWFIQILLYFFGGMIAASNQMKVQHLSANPTEGIVNAARGSGMVIFFILWIYIIIRSIVLDDSGLFAGMGIVFSLGFGFVDLVLAIALGSFSGNQIRKKNEYID